MLIYGIAQTDGHDNILFFRSDCENKFFFYAMDHLMNLQGRGMIDQLGLYGFGADSMNALLVEDAPVTSNQVLSVSMHVLHPVVSP